MMLYQNVNFMQIEVNSWLTSVDIPNVVIGYI